MEGNCPLRLLQTPYRPTLPIPSLKANTPLPLWEPLQEDSWRWGATGLSLAAVAAHQDLTLAHTGRGQIQALQASVLTARQECLSLLISLKLLNYQVGSLCSLLNCLSSMWHF